MATPKIKNPNSGLPEDILHDILLRFPVKSLSQYKLVCKSWLSVISSPVFIKTHLSISTNDPHFTHHHLLLGDYQWAFSTCSVNSLLNESVAPILELDYPRDEIKRVVGYCNGLVCLLASYNHVFFWNPCTRKSRRLPKLSSARYTTYGFGYDESNYDFKVFVVSFTLSVSVYSSKSDSWRLIGNFPFGRLISVGKFANGAIHWISVLGETKTIVSLDIKTETYGEVMLPKFVESACNRWTLDTLGESLILVCEEDRCFDLWRRKECGVKEYCWTKLFTIPYDFAKRIYMNNGIYMNKCFIYVNGLRTEFGYPKLICICANGDILLTLCSSIILYNTKQNTFKDLHFRFNGLHVYTYVESLVSPIFEPGR